MKYFFVIIATFFLLGIFSARADDLPAYRLSLDECVQMALNNNEEIKEAHYDIYAAIARKVEATKRYVPVVKYEYRFAPVPKDLDNPAESVFDGDLSVFNSIYFEAGIPVTTFGKLQVARELADIGIEASELQKYRKADEVVLEIYKLYYGILYARESIVIAKKGLDAVQKKIEELEKEEKVDQLEILKLKAIYYQVEKKMDEAKNKGIIALAMLKYRIGLEDDAHLDVKDRALLKENFKLRPLEQLMDETKIARPEFKLLSFAVQAKQKQVFLEKKEYLPKLVLGSFVNYGLSPGIVGDEDENTFTNPFNFFKAGVGLELSGELDFRKIKSKVDFARAEVLKSIAQKRSKYHLLEIDLKNSYLDLQQKEKLLWRAEKEERSANQIVFLTKSNLDIGIGDKKEYLEALQSHLLIQAAVFENIYNYNVAVATLKQKLGLLYKRGDLHNSIIMERDE